MRTILAKLILKIPFSRIEKFLRLLSLSKLFKWELNLLGLKSQKFANFLTSKNISEIYSKVAFTNNIEDIFIDKNNLHLVNSDIECLSNLDSSHNMMYLDMKTYLPDDVLFKVDRAAMHSSLETRLPMLDIRLMDYAWQIPISKKIKILKGKWVLRKLLKRYLPTHLFQRPKSGFSVPIGEWLKGPLKEWAEELIDSNRLKNEAFFNHDAVHKKWQEHLTGKKDWSNLIWSILIFQIWLKQNK
tara:strand:- start:18 stop:746 length:729 start_codon:yes stop_codon:yes gene_type:complete